MMMMALLLLAGSLKQTAEQTANLFNHGSTNGLTHLAAQGTTTGGHFFLLVDIVLYLLVGQMKTQYSGPVCVVL